MRFRMLPAAAALATVLLLAGCVPSDPIITPEPTPDTTPVFASDEEALAAATEAYGKYLSVTDAIFQDGGNDLGALNDVAAGDLLESTIRGFELAKDDGLRSIGKSSFGQVTLQRYEDGSLREGVVVVYLCEDLSDVDVLDANNESVVSKDRPNRVLYEVVFDLSNDRSHLIASDRDAWNSESC